MAVTSLTTTMAGAINYTVVTDSSADWSSVANSTYFYDKIDKLVHYKDSVGTVQEIFSGSGITVGTTPVISGANNRVFFQASGVVAQDGGFIWDNTNKRLGVGASPASTVRLDVRAQGALSTDIAFRVRNSADTRDIFSVTGNGVLFKPHASANNDTSQNVFVSEMVDGRNKIRLFTKGSFNASASIGISFQSDAAGNTISSYTLAGASILNNNSYKDNGNLSIFHVGGSDVTQYSYLQLRNFNNSATNIYISRTGTIILNPDNAFSQVRGLAIFGGTLGTTADRVISVGNGTSPTTSTADNFQFWSADIVAGNAAPHFRTENGSVIKLYQSPIFSSIKDIVENTGLSGVNEMIYAKEQVIPFGALSIDFTEPKIYGKSTVANSSNIIDDLTNAKIGVIQKIYHNSAVPPTVPAGWVLLSGAYKISVLNIITAEWCEGTRVEYKIIQG